MIDKIDDAIRSLAVDIDLLSSLPHNARRGNIDAIKASYNKFGQVKPIVAVRSEDGTITVIAGNHQLEAAKQLHWDQIAVSIVDLDHEDALAFALADNRISDLGTTDNELLLEMINEVMSVDEEFFDILGWDDFSVASIENSVINKNMHGTPDSNAGWTAPEIIITEFNSRQDDLSTPAMTSTDNMRSSRDEAAPSPQSVSNETIVTQGSTSTSAAGVRNASIQFTLVFETSEQQSKWYSFLKWLKESPVYDGDTTSERLLDFVSQHSPRG